MIIFPLSIAGKIILVAISVVLGVIYYALARPLQFRKLVRKLTGKRDLTKSEQER